MKSEKLQLKNKNWRKVKLEEITDIEYGKDLPTQELKQSGYPVYGGNGIIGYSDKYLYKEPKIIIGCRGAYSGNVFMTSSKSFVTHNSLILNFKDDSIHEKFIFYKLLKANVKSTITGSAQPQITIKELQQLEIEIPQDINEQKRIADILSAFDDKIELNNKIIKTLEKMTSAIFKEWFVNSEKLKVKSEKLGNLVHIEYGRGPVSSQLKKSGYPVYGANGVIGYFDSYKFPDRQIIVGCRGVVGNVNLTLPKCTVTHNSLIITPKNHRKIFFYYLLKNKNLDAVVGGSAQPQITIRDLEQFQLLIPDEKLQDKFESIAGTIEEKRLNAFCENQKLAALRDLLLPKLMSGEIRV